MNSLQIASALVRIPSVNPSYDSASRGESAAAAWIREWAVGRGIEAAEQPVLDGRANVMLFVRNGEGPHVHFNGHMDTVAVDGMTIEPFSGEVREGRLWGRGSADMKGPLACMLETADWMKTHPEAWRGVLSVGCMVDEEYRFRGVKAMLEANPLPDLAVVGEPTRLRVVRGCKGCLRQEIAARGRAAHSSRPEQGRNAIAAMARAIPAMEDYFAKELSKFEHPGFGPSTGSIGLIEGGTGVNIVPEECRIQIDIRLLPGQDWRGCLDGLEAAARSAAGGLDGISFEFAEPYIVDAAFELDAGHPLVDVAREVVGAADSEVVHYSCDGSKIAAKGVPCIVLGPGDIAEAHTARESISIEDLGKGTETYIELARRLMPAP